MGTSPVRILCGPQLPAYHTGMLSKYPQLEDKQVLKVMVFPEVQGPAMMRNHTFSLQRQHPGEMNLHMSQRCVCVPVMWETQITNISRGTSEIGLHIRVPSREGDQRADVSAVSREGEPNVREKKHKHLLPN